MAAIRSAAETRSMGDFATHFETVADLTGNARFSASKGRRRQRLCMVKCSHMPHEFEAALTGLMLFLELRRAMLRLRIIDTDACTPSLSHAPTGC